MLRNDLMCAAHRDNMLYDKESCIQAKLTISRAALKAGDYQCDKEFSGDNVNINSEDVILEILHRMIREGGQQND